MRESVAFFHKNLVTDAPAGRVEVDPVYSGKGLNSRIFFQVLFRLILDVVIQSEDDLFRVVYARSTDGLESIECIGFTSR